MAPKKRIGFTLVEMLVVVSVIGLLIAISVAAFSSITKHSKVTSTRGYLAVLRSMVSAIAAGDPTLKSLGGGGLVAAPEWDPPNAAANLAAAEQNTSTILRRLMIDPSNRTSYEKIPRKLNTDAKGFTLNPAIPLDDFGNPMLFVPAGGLWEVTRGGLKWGDPLPSGNNPPPPTNPPIRAPDSQAFWVSAGPDGSFNKGDDNLYSYEN